jgi:hypothetical protein
MKDMELLESQLNILGTAMSFASTVDEPENPLSTEFVLRKYFKMSDEDYAENKKLLEKEKQANRELNQDELEREEDAKDGSGDEVEEPEEDSTEPKKDEDEETSDETKEENDKLTSKEQYRNLMESRKNKKSK